MFREIKFKRANLIVIFLILMIKISFYEPFPESVPGDSPEWRG